MKSVALSVFSLIAAFSLSGFAENRFESLPKVEYLTFDVSGCRIEREHRLSSNHITQEEFDFLVSKGAVSVHALDGRPIGYCQCSR